MRTLIGIAVALVAASAAAATPPGKGNKPPTSGVGCKPAVAVVLTGSLGANGSPTLPFSLSVTVTGGNNFAKAYKLAGTTSVTVTSSTKINRGGDHNAADLKSGDRVNIQARACKADLAGGATPTLVATRITAHAAKS
jgi:hypothetical protein